MGMGEVRKLTNTPTDLAPSFDAQKAMHLSSAKRIGQMLVLKSNGCACRGVVLAVLFLLAAPSALSQRIEPIIQELKGSATKPAKGEFQITNNSVQPMNVVLEPRSMMFAAIPGQPSYVPLAPGTDVKLSETSFRVPPKASHTVWFEVRCSDCGVAIYSSMVVGRTVQGLQVALHIPEVVYTCERAKGCRDRVTKKTP